MKLFLAVALGLLASAQARNMGSINVEGYGDIYILAPDWAAGNVIVENNGFTLNAGGRIYFGGRPADGMEADAYWQTPLMDKHFAYEIDVSQVGCHCNAASYFINMPGGGPGDGGDYYCDANYVGSQWCPEYDTFEGNKYTMVSTFHKCYGSAPWWDSCDRGGCGTNAYNYNSNMMCPEDRCTINTNRQFTVSHFQNNDMANVWMGQEGREASFNVCGDGGYAHDMANSYGGMVFSASLWGGGGINMDWLDGMTGCGGECNLGGSRVTFKNFQLY